MRRFVAALLYPFIVAAALLGTLAAFAARNIHLARETGGGEDVTSTLALGDDSEIAIERRYKVPDGSGGLKDEVDTLFTLTPTKLKDSGEIFIVHRRPSRPLIEHEHVGVTSIVETTTHEEDAPKDVVKPPKGSQEAGPKSEKAQMDATAEAQMASPTAGTPPPEQLEALRQAKERVGSDA